MNFKTHFTEAHVELQATDTGVDELGYHSANSLVNQIFERVQVHHDNINFNANIQNEPVANLQPVPESPEIHPPPPHQPRLQTLIPHLHSQQACPPHNN